MKMRPSIWEKNSLWMSVSFSDLPKDVIWMIFQFVIKDHFIDIRGKSFDVTVYELGGGYVLPNYFGTSISCETVSLALINKTTLKLIRSKTFKVKNGWFFVKGSLLKLKE
jgi:hypothetical protein